jgi:hypothetical protein
MAKSRPEFLLGAVNQHAQIVASNAKPEANFVFGLLFQQGAKDGLVPVGELGKYSPDHVASFLGDNEFLDAHDFVLDFGVRRFQREIPGARPIVFQKNVVTDGIDEGTQAFRFADRAVGTDGTNYARERFLTEIIDCFGWKTAGAQLQLEQLREIGDEMSLRRRVSFTEALKIGLVKVKKFQNCPRSAGKYSREGEQVAMELRRPQKTNSRMKRI